MKNFRLILIALAFSFTGLSSNAQYKRMPIEKETTWQQIGIYFYSVFDTIDFIHQGDTTIFGKLYQKLYNGSIADSNYIGGYRDSTDGRVYFLVNSNVSSFGEVLLYDFSMEIGDTLDFYPLGGSLLEPTKMTPLNIYCVEVYNPYTRSIEERKAMSMQWLNKFETGKLRTYQWIEGFGSTKGLLWRGEPSGLDFDHYLLDIYQDNVSIVNVDSMVRCNPPINTGISNAANQVKFKVFPNPFNDHITLEMPGLTAKEMITIEIFDSSARLTYKQSLVCDGQCKLKNLTLEPGLYIIRLQDSAGNQYSERLLKV